MILTPMAAGADIVIARACPELFGTLIIMLQCKVDYSFQVLRIQFHILSPHKDYAISSVRKNCKVVVLPRYKLQIGCFPRARVSINESQCELNKNAVRSGEYLVSPLVRPGGINKYVIRRP